MLCISCFVGLILYYAGLGIICVYVCSCVILRLTYIMGDV